MFYPYSPATAETIERNFFFMDQGKKSEIKKTRPSTMLPIQSWEIRPICSFLVIKRIFILKEMLTDIPLRFQNA